MDLSSAITVSRMAVRKECLRLKWPHEDDIFQNVTTRIWLLFKAGDQISKSLIYYTVKGVVADSIRDSLRRSSMKMVSLTDSQWGNIEDTKSNHRVGIEYILDSIEGELEPDELFLFRHLRAGHNHKTIASMTGLNIHTLRRDIAKMLNRAREIYNEQSS